MRRALPAADFDDWFAAFLPNLATRRPAALFAPASVSDRTDGKIAHLDGLNLSRAWCWRLLAKGHPQAALMHEAADIHLAASLPHVAGDYMGEHWHSWRSRPEGRGLSGLSAFLNLTSPGARPIDPPWPTPKTPTTGNPRPS